MSMSENHPTKRQGQSHASESPDQRARRRALGDRLRDYYDAVAREPVPDEFDSLLEQLAQSANARGGSEGSKQ